METLRPAQQTINDLKDALEAKRVKKRNWKKKHSVRPTPPSPSPPVWMLLGSRMLDGFVALVDPQALDLLRPLFWLVSRLFVVVQPQAAHQRLPVRQAPAHCFNPADVGQVSHPTNHTHMKCIQGDFCSRALLKLGNSAAAPADSQYALGGSVTMDRNTAVLWRG